MASRHYITKNLSNQLQLADTLEEVVRMDWLAWLDKMGTSTVEDNRNCSPLDENTRMQFIAVFFNNVSPSIAHAKRLQNIFSDCLDVVLQDSTSFADKIMDESLDFSVLCTVVGAARGKVTVVLQLLGEILHRWILLREQVYEIMNEVFLETLEVLEKHPLKNRRGIRNRARYTYIILSLSLATEDLLSSMRPWNLSDLPVDMFVSTFRRLVIQNLFTSNIGKIARAKDWYEFLVRLPPLAVAKSPTDQVLQDLTSVLWNANAGNTSRRYSPICMSLCCKHMETPNKPHKFRCHKCWHFHTCSKNCEKLAEAIGLHQCEAISAETATALKTQTEAYLAKTDHVSSLERLPPMQDTCRFCSSKLENLLVKTMGFCQGCNQVQYCSKSCQKWDWRRGTHKAECSKK